MKRAVFFLAALTTGAQAQTLTLEPPPQAENSDSALMSVGVDTMARYRQDLQIEPELPAPPGLTLVPPSKAGPRINTFKGPDFLDTDNYNHVDFRSDVVRIMVPGRVAPFASFAREAGRLPDDDGRIGAGAGAKWNLSPNANFGTELLVFPASATNLGGDALKNADTKLMTRLELKF